jgi:hypothetical protein
VPKARFFNVRFCRVYPDDIDGFSSNQDDATYPFRPDANVHEDIERLNSDAANLEMIEDHVSKLGDGSKIRRLLGVDYGTIGAVRRIPIMTDGALVAWLEDCERQKAAGGDSGGAAAGPWDLYIIFHRQNSRSSLAPKRSRWLNDDKDKGDIAEDIIENSGDNRDDIGKDIGEDNSGSGGNTRPCISS